MKKALIIIPATMDEMSDNVMRAAALIFGLPNMRR